jgi:signal transduction histidine kinase
MEKNKNLGIIFYLSFPLLMFFLFSLFALASSERTYDLFPQYALIFSIAFIILFGLQFFALREKMMPQFTDIDAMRKALQNQEVGAKMLIRKDLELVRANEKLRGLDAIKSNFISVAAHQLRTPLTCIKWTIDMILSDSLGPLTTKQRGFLMKGYESNERMIILVNDMLVADRAESDRMPYQFAPLQIVDLVNNVLYEVTAMASKKNITIEMAPLSAPLPHVIVDAEKIRAVIQNLLENAIKYTPNGGKINVAASATPESIQVTIKDTGIGIPEEQQSNIFGRFFRAPNAIRIQTDGSGLGLFITKSIVERHGGKIWFESVQNQGTTFYFTLPITEINHK